MYLTDLRVGADINKHTGNQEIYLGKEGVWKMAEQIKAINIIFKV